MKIEIPKCDFEKFKKLECLTGEKIGLWTIGEKIALQYPCGDKKVGYVCTCECGKILKIDRSSLLNGKSKKCCIKCADKLNSGSSCYAWKGYEKITGDYWKTVKINAKKRNINFNITMKEAWDKFLNQEERCFYTGVKLIHKRNCKDTNWTASIDRIDSNKPYEFDNICWCHLVINKIKTDLELDNFYDWCSWVSNFN